MFTYGYIREAVMAHLDIDETEAQAMSLLQRFHIFANEAMQAICSSKPLYQYLDITVVDKFAVLVVEGGVFRPATKTEIEGILEEGVVLATEQQTKDYYHNLNTYEKFETVPVPELFIAFANKKCYKVTKRKPNLEEQLQAEAFGTKCKTGYFTDEAKIDDDFAYIGRNALKFYHAGRYYIPAKFMWFKFTSDLSDRDEIDMPTDILLTIPLYVASICLQIDNSQKANIKRNEFEMALARCTSTDFLTLNDMRKSW